MTRILSYLDRCLSNSYSWTNTFETF